MKSVPAHAGSDLGAARTLDSDAVDNITLPFEKKTSSCECVGVGEAMNSIEKAPRRQ